ncbi:ABC transporter family substrate-binding protein [Kitasatospora sp. NE20-6]|uniref:ABC transporter family substrate-binding protein n=1 Tax=Kitasatospora sp. NE20-6 TaxID=2859066 RepID=UPI0038B4167B
MTRPRFPIAVTAAAAALVLALCSCSSTGADGGTTLGAPARAADADLAGMTRTDVNGHARTDLRRGGGLQWAIDQLPAQWNPLHVDGTGPATLAVTKALLPTFWRSDAGGTQTPNQAYLLDAAAGATADGRQTVTWTLNPKAHWSDGTPITWKDLQATWKALRGTDPGYRTASTAGFDRVESVTRGHDDHQAVMVFRTRFAEWQAMFNNAAGAPLLPAAYVGTAEGFNTAFLGRLPVSAGPFRQAGTDREAHTVTVEADPDWWGEKPLLDRIVFRAMEPADMADAFTRGTVDYFDVSQDAAGYRTAEAAPDGAVRKAGGPGMRVLALNGRSPQLTDPAVRRAVLQAIDRETMARTGLQGLDWPYTPMNNHFLVPGQNGYQDNSAGLSQYDPQAASDALEAAGWHSEGGRTRTRDGTELSLRLVTPAGSMLAANEAVQVVQDLRAVGVRVTVESTAAAGFLDAHVNRHDFDLTVFGMPGTPFPATSSRGTFQQGAGGNVSQVGSDALDRAMDAAASATTTEEGYKAINRADEEAWRVAGLVPLYQRPVIYGVRRTLANLGAPGLSDTVYENIGFEK